MRGQNPSIIHQIKSLLYRFDSPVISRFHVMPSYALAHSLELCQEYDVLLTTDQEVLLNTPGFYLVPCILNHEDARQLRSHFEKRLEDVIGCTKAHYQSNLSGRMSCMFAGSDRMNIEKSVSMT